MGHDLPKIFIAVEEARRDAIVDCVSKRGFSLDAEQRRNLGPDPAPTSGYVSSLIADIDADVIKPVPPADRGKEDPALASAVTGCSAQAEADFPNPNVTVLDLLKDFDSDVTARSSADPRVIEANSEFDACVQATGYVPEAGLSAVASISSETDQIVSSYLGSGDSKASVLAHLRSLQKVEDEVGACVSRQTATVNKVVAEVQQKLLQAEPGLLASIAEQVGHELDKYKAYLATE